MKLLILFFIFAHNIINANITNLPNGLFAGKGKWDSKSGKKGYYETLVDINNNVFQSNYFFEHQINTANLTFVFKKESWVNIYYKNKLVGEGFCLEFQCHYWLDLNNDVFSETLTFYENNIYRIGFRKTINDIYKWEELLHPQKNITNPPLLPVIPKNIKIADLINSTLPTLPINPPIVPVLPIIDIKELAHYLGEGSWTDKQGNKENYYIILGINSEQLLSNTLWRLRSIYFALNFKFNKDWFSVSNQNKFLGNGFCSKYQCQYLIESEKEIFVETLTLYKNKFNRSGYRKKKDGSIVRWNEQLYSTDKAVPNINLPFMPK